MTKAGWNVLVAICSCVAGITATYIVDTYVDSKMLEDDQLSTSQVQSYPPLDDVLKSMTNGMPGTVPFTEERYKLLLNDLTELQNSSGSIRGGVYSEDGLCDEETPVTSRVLIWEKNGKINFVNASIPETIDTYDVNAKVSNLLVRLRIIPVRSMSRLDSEARVGYKNGVVYTDKDKSWNIYHECGSNSIISTLEMYKEKID